jgi:hypothetical protein
MWLELTTDWLLLITLIFHVFLLLTDEIGEPINSLILYSWLICELFLDLWAFCCCGLLLLRVRRHFLSDHFFLWHLYIIIVLILIFNTLKHRAILLLTWRRHSDGKVILYKHRFLLLPLDGRHAWVVNIEIEHVSLVAKVCNSFSPSMVTPWTTIFRSLLIIQEWQRNDTLIGIRVSLECLHSCCLITWISLNIDYTSVAWRRRILGHEITLSSCQ